MIWTNCRKLFKRWKLSEREAFFGTTVMYEIQGLIKLERYFKPEEDEELHDMLFDLFWKYEWHWQQMSARQISYLLWVHHSKVDNILARAKQRIRDLWHLDLYYENN